MSIEDEGRFAEKAGRIYLKEHGYNVFQPDWIAQDLNGAYTLWEIKYLEPFDPPPFWGHGTGIHQIIARLNFQKATGIVCWLLILDKVSNIWYSQRLDKLEAGERHDTKNGIRIYPITSFYKEE